MLQDEVFIRGGKEFAKPSPTERLAALAGDLKEFTFNLQFPIFTIFCRPFIRNGWEKVRSKAKVAQTGPTMGRYRQKMDSNDK